MKSFAIYDEERTSNTPIGYLFYYEKSESFIIELCSELDEWEVPLLFQGLVRKGIYTIPREISFMWVQERIIPSGRQNIGEILKTHKLKEYSEIAMLSLARGRSSQDDCYVKEVSQMEIPEEIQKRRLGNVIECFVTENGAVLCLFQDNSVRLISLEKLLDKYRDVAYVLQRKDLLESVQVGVGGYSITFNETIEIATSDLRAVGELLPLSANDFFNFIRKNVVDTTSACFMIDCSRQNLSYLVRENKLNPILRGTKENLYTKGELTRIKND